MASESEVIIVGDDPACGEGIGVIRIPKTKTEQLYHCSRCGIPTDNLQKICCGTRVVPTAI